MPRCFELGLAFGVHRAVGTLGHHLHLQQLGFGGAHLILERTRYEEVGRCPEELFARDRLGGSEASDRAHALHVVGELVHVEAAVVAQVARVVAHGHHLHAHRIQDQTGVRAHVAEALDDHLGAIELHVVIARPLHQAVHDALARGLDASERASARDGLARDHRALRVLLIAHHAVHVRVHEPGHLLRARAHVGRGDVVIGTDVVAELVREATRQAHALALGESTRVALHGALGAAKRDVHQGALPGHHRSQRAHLVEVDVRVVANAALVRSQDVVVLNAIAGEHLELAAVHAHREVHDELGLRLREHRRDVARQVHHLRSALEIALDHLERRRSSLASCPNHLLSKPRLIC